LKIGRRGKVATIHHAGVEESLFIHGMWGGLLRKRVVFFYRKKRERESGGRKGGGRASLEG